jgi:gamma-glutamyl-gamma-aminobutyrate hydrolase PuuD
MQTRKPIIGITCSLERDDPASMDGRGFDYAKREYYRRIEAHGGIPVLLPNVEQESAIMGFLSHVGSIGPESPGFRTAAMSP